MKLVRTITVTHVRREMEVSGLVTALEYVSSDSPNPVTRSPGSKPGVSKIFAALAFSRLVAWLKPWR